MPTLERLDRKYLAAGQIVFSFGEIGDCAFLVEDGELEVIDHATGKALGYVNKGELFGEIALVDRLPRTATVRAVRESVLVEIRRPLVEELLADANPVIRLLLKVILERYRTNFRHHPASVLIQGDDGDTLHAEVNEQLTLLKDMKDAIERREFTLFYQPIVTLPEAKIAGFEALIRWRHPERGLIPPNKFLGIAEETGLIRQIGRWTIEQACRDWLALRKVPTTERRFVSINLSGKQLTDENFAEASLAIQSRYGVVPGEIKFELTETSLITDATLASAHLDRLHADGNSIALDDYGTGYSGLGHLQSYPFKVLKLDQTFVREIMQSSLSFQLVMNTIEMAKSLHLEIVAEGIETYDIAAALAEMGCNYAQGYLFGRPQPLEAWLPA